MMGGGLDDVQKHNMCILCGVHLEAGEELVCTLHAAQVTQVSSNSIDKFLIELLYFLRTATQALTNSSHLLPCSPKRLAHALRN
jgi:hypothetical protein